MSRNYIHQKAPAKATGKGEHSAPIASGKAAANKTMIETLLKEGANVQVNMSAQDLRAFGLNLLSEFAAQEASRKEMEAKGESYLSTNQVCKVLGVNRSTLWRWAKDGYLAPINMGGRSRYKQSSITKIMEERA